MEDFAGLTPKKKRQTHDLIVEKITSRKVDSGEKSEGSEAAPNATKDLTSKKRKTKVMKSSQKKAPRTLPVNELVTTSQRLEDANEESYIGKT